MRGKEAATEMKIRLLKSEYERLLHHAVACLPEEACGLLAGRKTEQEKLIEKVYSLPNAAEHFTISPEDQLKAILDMRENGLQMLGNWHSHPQTPSRMSEEDKRLAFDREASYLILSLAENEPVLRAFSVAGGDAETEELLIEEGQSWRN